MEAVKPTVFEDPRRKSRRKKDVGYLGNQNSGKGWHATEYSVGTPIFGKETEFPTFVPEMTTREVNKMMTDVIPNRTEIPKEIMRKARKNARMRILEGKSPFYSSKEK